jgi:hypothetical protein
MENNETQRTSFTYQGLRASLQAALPTIDLAAAGVPPAVLALAEATGGPLLEAVRTQLAAGVGAMNQALTNYLVTQRGGVGGCFTDMLMTLRDDPSRSHEHPYLGYIDQYGEVAIAECLREIATPYYDRVEVLTDSEATFANFKWTVEQLHQQGYTMDLLLDVHGCGLPQTRNNVICDTVPSLRFADGNAYLDGEVQQNGEPLGPTLRSLNSFFNGTSGFLDAQGAFVAAAESGYVRLNNVYMVACWGSNFNEMWLDMGASASNGAEELNYFVLSSPFTFLDQFTRNGAPLDEAARRAYEEERVLFEGLPTPVTLDFRWIPGCGACVYPVDVSAVYRRRLALALGDLYGEDEHQPVEPVPSSRRVGMQRQRLEPGTTEIVMGDSLGRPLLGLRPTTVTSGGTVTLATSAVGPELGIHQSLGTSDLQYDIAVSAVLEGATEVCLTWNEGRFQQEAGVRLLHFEGGAWQDHTTSLDTDANVVCATVTSFSPFAMVEFVNRAPIATAGPDRQVEASGPGGATVALDGAASTDPDGDALTFRWTWAGGQADGPAPSITLPVGTHAVTLTVTDAFGAASTATLSIAVVPPALTGRMLGHGRLDDPDTRYTFAFTVTRKSDGTASGEVALKVYPRATQKPARPEAARFTADAVTSVAFFADDTLGAGPGASGQATGRGERRPEAVAFSGSGRWNGVPGHRVDARATAGRDKAGTGATVALTITAPDGTVVASVSGEVQDGRIVATGGPPASR